MGQEVNEYLEARAISAPLVEKAKNFYMLRCFLAPPWLCIPTFQLSRTLPSALSSARGVPCMLPCKSRTLEAMALCDARLVLTAPTGTLRCESSTRSPSFKSCAVCPRARCAMPNLT
eukprot:2705696-Rhodomonas_salina.8